MAKRQPADVPRELELAGELCLAFVNTAARRPDERYTASKPPPEATAPAFDDYGGLVAWARRMGVLEPDLAERLGRAASERPDLAAAVFARAAGLRTALGKIFTALARKRKPAAADMGVLNGALAGALPAHQVAAEDGVFRWTWAGEGDALDRMLWPVALSAAELLVSEDRRWVRRCAEKLCPRLFVDRKTHRRRWCDPNTCGSSVRGRRHYRRAGSRPWR